MKALRDELRLVKDDADKMRGKSLVVIQENITHMFCIVCKQYNTLIALRCQRMVRNYYLFRYSINNGWCLSRDNVLTKTYWSYVFQGHLVVCKGIQKG